MRSKSPLMEGVRSGKVRPGSALPPAYGGSQCLEELQPEPEDVPTARDGLQGFLPEVLRTRFADPQLEELYRQYLRCSKRDYLVVGVFSCALLNIVGITLSAWQFIPSQLPHLICMTVFLCVNILLIALLRVHVFSARILGALSVVTWFYIIAQLYVDIAFGRAPVTPSSGLGWQIYLCFTLYLMLAVRLRWCLVLSVTSCVLHTLLVTILPSTQPYGSLFAYPNVVAANALLYLCATLLGCLGYFFSDRSQRRAFLETKASLSVSLGIEQSSKEQERLLLSVLPRHVAGEMIRDLGAQEEGGQFRKIYMSRHDNVSILFADIVGFTALSSKVTPRELVKILNDLFATFDKLAHNYHQLRIKILGDCYYCICGCPVPRPDHAVLAIHMGLAMVEAISEVRNKTQSGVNMRVGIHTGSVLGGVLGQNRWQYDVLGKEVILANQMESGGVAGRVHISEATAGFLMGEFALEPGDGESRDEGIKQAGIKTFLIKSVIQPYPEGTLDAEGSLKTKQMLETEEHVSRLQNVSVDDVTVDIQAEDADSMDKLRDALLEREQSLNLNERVNFITLRFKDVSMETEFNAMKPVSSGPVLIATCLVVLCTFLCHLCVLPRNTTVVLAFLVCESILVVMVTLTLANLFPKKYPQVLVRFGDWYHSTLWFRSLYITVIIVIMTFASLLDRYGCTPRKAPEGSDVFSAADNQTGGAISQLGSSSDHCDYPAYFLHFPVLVLCSLLLMMQVGYIVKIVLMVTMTAVISFIDMVVLSTVHDEVDDIIFEILGVVSATPARSRVVLAIGLAAIVLSLWVFTRLHERYDRRLFFYRQEVDDMRRQVDVITQKNESLIYNLLPAHVAKDFIGTRRKDEELYSQAYDEVGVLFAACPNFYDHYTEDAVNNNGMEWMRFLNEILSDYDDLLTEPRFRNIIKIKTIGPTYMAASGMNLEKPVSKEASSTERWQHLADLVDFALALKEALDRINSQSFNSFMLRIGINHGSVLAGVIGARKPHYDIWGNSVNVSSRMESTGQLGKIQVVQPTMELLQPFGYQFEKRGLVKVKGKGELMTYFLTGKEQVPLPNQVVPF